MLFFNAYAPTDKKCVCLFLETLTFFITGRHFTAISGGFNCIRSASDRESSADAKTDITSNV